MMVYNFFIRAFNIDRQLPMLIKNGLNGFLFNISKTSWFTSVIYVFFTFLSFLIIFVVGCLTYTHLVLRGYAFTIPRGLFCFDSISVGLVFITSTIFPWCFLYVHSREDRHFWALYLIVTEVLVVLAFISLDLLVFFIIFELLIFPMYKLILGWGSKGDLRLTAAKSFIMYTVLGSILLLFTIVLLHSMFGTTNILLLRNHSIWLPDTIIIVIFIAFATKVPTFPFYHWLTLAHVEASTVGSVILAALILKLGSYGFIRFLIPLYREHLYFYLWSYIAVVLFIVSILFAALSAAVQTDIKRIVAYSSIEHMNLSMLGLALFSSTSAIGSYIIIIAHGWIAAGLFFAVGWLYDSRHQRDILYYRGYAAIDGWWSVLFGLLLLANIGFPFTLNFLGEIQILITVFGREPYLLGLIFFVIMANIFYSLKLGFIMWGAPYSFLLNPPKYSVFKQILLVLLLGVPLLLVIVASHPEIYQKVTVVLANCFSFWGLAPVGTFWPNIRPGWL